jgi:hypothetical protein
MWPPALLLTGLAERPVLPGLFFRSAVSGRATRAAARLSRKCLTWTSYLDMPIELQRGQADGTSMAPGIGIIISATAGPSVSTPNRLAAQRAAWLVVVAISNCGLTAIRARGFTAPLVFAFPDHEIHGVQIDANSAARPRAGQPDSGRPRMPSLRADQHRIELGGDFQLNRNDEFLVIVVLTSNPPDIRPGIRQEGRLARGAIIMRP